MNTRKLVVMAAALTIFWGAGLAQAKIALNPDFQGTVMITTPEGKVIMLDAGNPIPEIPKGATLEVFQGQMTVNTEAGDEVSVGCLGETGKLTGAGSATAVCGEDSGKIKSLKGDMKFEDSTLKEGEEKTVTLGGKEAPTTAAGDETGSAADLGIPPVDSRSIETSPSQ